MPNWSYNAMRVHAEGEAEIKEVKRLRDFIKATEVVEGTVTENPFSFQNIIPMPEELNDTVAPTRYPDSKEAKALRAKYGFDNWYDWRWEHWGTKWDACDVAYGMDDSPEDLYIEFNTAWSFPTPIAVKLSKLFPKLTIAFDANEESGAYDFTVEFKDGEVVYYAEWEEGKDGERIEVPKPEKDFWK